ncbi:MAG: HD domain-containing phosphohydrolase, partial [Candidatus Eremiobacterota bacterium]
LTLARRQFEKVVEANPRDGEAQYFLGVVQFKLGYLDLAIEAYQNAAQLHTNSALRYFTQGAFYSYNRQYDLAIEEYKKATELRPDTEADLQLFAVLQLQATVGIDLAQQGRELQTFAKAREEVFIRFVQAISSALDAKDPYTRFHSKQVAYIATRLAQQLGMPDEKLKEIMIGGWLHDIGKIGIRDTVLNKEGKLTDEERKLIQRHPEIGAEILRKVFPADEEEAIYKIPWDVIPMVLHHHEKWDGTGYPHGLKGDDIPFTAQIVGVADFYDALTTNRIYRKALTPATAMAEMRQLCGKFFNPALIDAFEAILDELVLAMPPPVELDEHGALKLGLGDDAWDGLTQSWNFVLK